MLTKDLLRLRRQGGEVRPQWLRADAKNGPFVEEIATLFRSSLGQSQGEIKTQALELAQARGVEPLLVRGLLKVCFDAATTEEKADLDYLALRRAIFLASTRRLASAGSLSPEALRTDVAAALLSPDLADGVLASAFLDAGTLYADLPEESPLTAFPLQDAAALVSRYNVGMAQCLMVNARSVVIRLPAGDRSLLRRLWKAMRFHGLIARHGTKPEGAGDEHLHIDLEGPLSLHMHSLKYGFSLAAFLPALLCEDGWILEASVSLTRGEEHLFRLEPRPEVRMLRRTFHQYAPPELALVFRSLEAAASAASAACAACAACAASTAALSTSPGFTVTQADDFLDLPGEVACFPDFKLSDTAGRAAFLEIFHPWHQAALAARIDQLQRSPGTPLLLAVSRKAAKAVPADALDALEASAPGHLFLFRETPVAGKVLESWLPLLTLPRTLDAQDQYAMPTYTDRLSSRSERAPSRKRKSSTP